MVRLQYNRKTKEETNNMQRNHCDTTPAITNECDMKTKITNNSFSASINTEEISDF